MDGGVNADPENTGYERVFVAPALLNATVSFSI